MGELTKIQWTESTWTPIRARNRATGKVGWHCEHASPGCINCYSERFNLAFGSGLAFKPGLLPDVAIFLDEKMLAAPLRWRKPRRIFVCSMTDLFADFVPDEMIDRVFAVMALSAHIFQVLTKRADRMRIYMDRLAKSVEPLERIARELGHTFTWEGHPLLPWPLPNVWLGTSVEDQRRADERIHHLLSTPAAVRFVSAEPLLEPIDLRYLQPSDPPVEIDALSGTHGLLRTHRGKSARLDWVIVGGESGAHARHTPVLAIRSLVDQCRAANVPCFVKQLGRFPCFDSLDHPRQMVDKKGGDWSEWPEDLRVREMPA